MIHLTIALISINNETKILPQVLNISPAFSWHYKLFLLQIYQGYREGLEDSGLVVLQTFMGFASALGCVGFGLVIVKPSTQCLISRQYLCQAALVGIGRYIPISSN